MTTSRRRFLRHSASSLALAPIVPVGRLAALESGSAGGESGAGAAVAAFHAQDAWVAAARARIPAATGSVYFQTGGVGPSPNAVIAAVIERLAFQNRGPADPRYATAMARIEPDPRAQLGRVFGAGSDEVALTHSTSEGMGSVRASATTWTAPRAPAASPPTSAHSAVIATPPAGTSGSSDPKARARCSFAARCSTTCV